MNEIITAAKDYMPALAIGAAVLRWALGWAIKRFTATLAERDARLEARQEAMHKETQENIGDLKLEVKRINGSVRANTTRLDDHADRLARIEGPRPRRPQGPAK